MQQRPACRPNGRYGIRSTTAALFSRTPCGARTSCTELCVCRRDCRAWRVWSEYLVLSGILRHPQRASRPSRRVRSCAGNRRVSEELRILRRLQWREVLRGWLHLIVTMLWPHLYPMATKKERKYILRRPVAYLCIDYHYIYYTRPDKLPPSLRLQ